MTLSVKSVALASVIALGSLMSGSAHAAILQTADGASVLTKDGAAVLAGLVDADECEAGAAQVIASDRVVYFNFDKAGLTKQAKNELRHLAKRLRNTDKAVSISGFADRMGNATYNERLALKRAKAVHDYLVTVGLKAKKVEVRSFGKSAPKSECAADMTRAEVISCLAVDRRVEIEVE